MSLEKINGKVAVGIAVAVIVAFAVGVAAVHLFDGFSYTTTDDAYVAGRIHQVAPKISGTIRRVIVADNQTVRKGDLLAEIDTTDYVLRVKEAEAAYSAERAKYKEALTRVTSAETNLEIQETNSHQAESDRRRAERLFAEGAYPKEKLEKLQTAASLAKSQVKAAQEQILQVKTSADLEVALVRQREASLAVAKWNLSYTKLRAPADGVVTKKSVEEGNQVQPGQPLLAVVALNEVWVVANYKETQLKDIRSGQSAVVKVDTYPGQVFAGKVESIMAGTGAAFSLFPAENALGNYVKIVQRIPVKIVFDHGQDPQHFLRVGMSAVVKVRVK